MPLTPTLEGEQQEGYRTLSAASTVEDLEKDPLLRKKGRKQ